MKKTTLKKKKKVRVSQKDMWQAKVAASKLDSVAYSLKERFSLLSKISHPKFGIGIVTQEIGEQKLEAVFEDKNRVLMHNLWP